MENSCYSWPTDHGSSWCFSVLSLFYCCLCYCHSHTRNTLNQFLSAGWYFHFKYRTEFSEMLSSLQQDQSSWESFPALIKKWGETSLSDRETSRISCSFYWLVSSFLFRALPDTLSKCFPAVELQSTQQYFSPFSLELWLFEVFFCHKVLGKAF